MAGEWEAVPFERLLVEPVRNGIYKTKGFHGRGAKIVNMGELFAHPRLRSVPMKRVELSTSEFERFNLAEGDLIFARRSLTAEGAGKCSVVLEVDGPTTFESSIIRARPDPLRAGSLYLYYFFNSPSGFHSLDTIRRQVAVAGITGSDLSRLEIPVPSLAEQRAIAHILGTLDDKIELNQRMNETLEAMARALFRSWVLSVDLLHAKTADLVRDGVLEIGDGYRAKNTELGGEGLPFIRAGNLNNGFDTTGADILRTESVKKAGRKVCCTGDVAFTSKGTIGRFARVTEHTPRFVYSPQVCYWRSLDPSRLHPALLYCWMQSDELGAQITAAAGQTDMAPYVSLQDQRQMSMPVFPPSQFTLASRLDPLLARQSVNAAEAKTLAALRDALLPKLLSGDLRVPVPPESLESRHASTT